MPKIEHTVDVAVPVREAYDQWTQFEAFPSFMNGVEAVRQLDDTHLNWVATVAGERHEWDAEITEQTPDRRIAWTSVWGDRNAGSVEFERIGEERTRVTLTMDVEPSGFVQTLGTALGIPSNQVKEDLERFKEFIESRGRATGAWRGEVHQGTDPDVDDRSGERERELAGAGAGAGAQGAYASGPDLEPDTFTSGVATPGGATPDDPYGIGDGATTFDTHTTGTAPRDDSLDR